MQLHPQLLRHWWSVMMLGMGRNYMIRCGVTFTHISWCHNNGCLKQCLHKMVSPQIGDEYCHPYRLFPAKIGQFSLEFGVKRVSLLKKSHHKMVPLQSDIREPLAVLLNMIKNYIFGLFQSKVSPNKFHLLGNFITLLLRPVAFGTAYQLIIYRL